MGYKLLWLVVMIFCSCTQARQEGLIEAETSSKQGKPFLESLLDKSGSGLKLIDKTEYDKLWWSFYDSETDPTFSELDINDDKTVDYVFFGKKDHEIRLFFYLSSVEGYQLFIAEDFREKVDDGTGFKFGLAPEPPGRIDVVLPRIQSLILNSNAVNLMVYEVRDRVYYYQNNTIESFRTR